MLYKSRLLLAAVLTAESAAASIPGTDSPLQRSKAPAGSRCKQPAGANL